VNHALAIITAATYALTAGMTVDQIAHLWHPLQVALARQMYEETDEQGKCCYTVQQIADEFGVTLPVAPSTTAWPPRNEASR
jgi:hypothetical protein